MEKIIKTDLRKINDNSYEEVSKRDGESSKVIWKKYEGKNSSKFLDLMVDPLVGFRITQDSESGSKISCHASLSMWDQLLVSGTDEDTYEKGDAWNTKDYYSSIRPLRRGCDLIISTLTKYDESSKPFTRFTQGHSGYGALILEVEVKFSQDIVDKLIQSINRDPDVVITVKTNPKYLTNDKNEMLLDLSEYTYSSAYARISCETNINRPLADRELRGRLIARHHWTDRLSTSFTRFNNSKWMLLLWVYLIVRYVVNSS